MNPIREPSRGRDGRDDKAFGVEGMHRTRKLHANSAIEANSTIEKLYVISCDRPYCTVQYNLMAAVAHALQCLSHVE